jgi:6,7-dimethyl-8-ribityllumazine synthase
MFGADKGNVASNDSRLNGKKLSIGIVQARFNAPVTDALAEACKAELIALGVSEKDIDHITVPGALEVAVVLQAMAEKSKYDALIALGCIVRGETYHFELVANESGAGVTRVSMDYQVPIANAILTTENMPQAIARQEEKGRDAARVAVEMANLLESI